MAVAGAGAGAEIMVKVGAGAENKLFRLCNTAFDTRCSSRLKRLFLDHEEPVYKETSSLALSSPSRLRRLSLYVYRFSWLA